MILQFTRGTSTAPVGHAIVFFRSSSLADVAACYLVVPPIHVDMSRYVPPMLAGHIPAEAFREVQAIPLPPIPERVLSLAQLQRLADVRNDDLVDGGTLDLDNIERCLAAAAEAAQQYLGLYRAHVQTATTIDAPAAENPLSLDVNEVLFDLMGDNDRLMELAKLIGQLRYAIDGGDDVLRAETVERLRRLTRHLADKFRTDDLIAASQRPGPTGERLAQLYVDRCFKLSAEDYRAVGDIDRQIQQLSSA